VKITDPQSIAWELFAMLDEEADARDATVANVLDVAAIVVARYVERMTEELASKGLSNGRHCEEAAFRIFYERARALLEAPGRDTLH
jgi:hypothetical protein